MVRMMERIRNIEIYFFSILSHENKDRKKMNDGADDRYCS